ncbi:MAG: hypothetical protein PUF49_05140 [Firmicutes bacterium]|nr:hypothetical protein [Bacillota bacterium]
MIKKAVDFKTYKHVLGMSFNEFNRWTLALYKAAWQDGYKDKTDEYGENPLVLDEAQLYDLLRTVDGIGDKTANKIVERFYCD